MDEDDEQARMLAMGEGVMLDGFPVNVDDDGADEEGLDYDDDAILFDQTIPQYKPEQGQIIETCLSNIRTGGNVLVEYPSDGKRRLATLSALLQHIQYLTHEDQNQIQQVPGTSDRSSNPVSSNQKMYYATSSFQELEQVINELKKFKNTGCLQNVTLAVLAHPSQLCKSCDNNYPCSLASFTFNEFRFIKENGAVHSLCHIIEKAHSEKRCLFRYNRDIFGQANLILCTQEFIIAPDLRRKFQVNLENAVVIFDDGGNFENACYAAASTAITTLRLTVAAKCFKTFADTIDEINRKRQMESEELCEFVVQNNKLSRNLTQIASNIKEQAGRLTGRTQPSTDVFLEGSSGFGQDAVVANYKNYNEMIRQSLLHLETDNDIRNAVRKKGVDIDINLILSVQKLLSCINFVHNSISRYDYAFEISNYVPRGAQPANTFKMSYANLSTVVKSFMDEGVSSLIISSACLPSASILRQELSPAAEFHEGEDAIIPLQTHTDCFFAYCKQGPNKVTFDYSHANKGNETVQNEAGEAIINIMQRISNGVVVFLPSVNDLKDLITYWKDADKQNADKSIWDQMKEIKHIFCELDFKRAEDVKRQLEIFRERCTSPLGKRNGALLLALHREKVSQVMDFQPGQVRCFVALGISFHSPAALNISAKKAYFLSQPNLTEDERSKRNNLWYNAEAFYNLYRKIAHCVGREQDWLAALVFDTRMEDKVTGNTGEILVPRWMQNEWKGYSNFEELTGKLTGFVNRCNSIYGVTLHT